MSLLQSPTISIKLSAGFKTELAARASAAGQTMNSYVLETLRARADVDDNTDWQQTMTDCRHSEQVAQGIELQHADALEHFLQCIPADKQQDYWAAMRQDAHQGRACREGEHEANLAEMTRVADKLVTKIRKARAALEPLKTGDEQ